MMRSLCSFALAAGLLGAAPAPKFDPVPRNAQTAVVERYLQAMQNGAYDQAFLLLNDEARAYYRSAANFRSIYDADGFHVKSFRLLGTRGDAMRGRVFFTRTTTITITRTTSTRR
ncbi:MAG: hypothetical protein ABR591_00020 [Candidatus Velthaea sp.]